jgi:hypothetical protein
MANPERMRLEFWEWMIRGGEIPPEELVRPLGEFGLVMRDGVLKSWYGPCRARDYFGIPLNRDDGPIWTFDRDGASRIELPDGRTVCIGGEHEDWYDPDFYIYNDVVILGPSDEIEIYGYPSDVFPPTDSHSATLIGDQIIIIGCLGYSEQRQCGHTPVFALDLFDYHIRRIATSGEEPGWIFKHTADFDQNATITIRGGQIDPGGKKSFRHNVEDFALDVETGIWRRLTNRNWLQFSIRQADWNLFVLECGVEMEALLPSDVECSFDPDKDLNYARLMVRGVPISLTTRSIYTIDIIIEGALPPDVIQRVVETIRSNAEKAIHRQCVVEQL